jgi:hypothetical protein
MQIMRICLRLVTVSYAAALVVVTHTPRLEVSFSFGTPIPADKLLHFAAYGVLGFLVGLIAAEYEWTLSRWLPIAFACVAGFALLDEITQPLCGRHMEALDYVADAFGSAAGLVLAAGCSTAVSIIRGSANGHSR